MKFDWTFAAGSLVLFLCLLMALYVAAGGEVAPTPADLHALTVQEQEMLWTESQYELMQTPLSPAEPLDGRGVGRGRCVLVSTHRITGEVKLGKVVNCR